jgi:GLPGLI family protein
MKHFFLFFFFLFCISQVGFSQSMLVEYHFSMQDISPSNQTFVFNDTLSVFKQIQNLQTEGITIDDADRLFFYKDKKTGFVYDKSEVRPLFKETKYIKDSIPILDWELLSDTMTILKQKCYAAKTHFRGRNYKAFYAPSIPLPDGPWKFGGLPGLILKISSLDEENIVWTAIHLVPQYKEAIKIPDITKHTYFTWSNFVKSYSESVQKLQKKLRSYDTSNSNVKSSHKFPSIEIIYPNLHTGKGAEY